MDFMAGKQEGAGKLMKGEKQHSKFSWEEVEASIYALRVQWVMLKLLFSAFVHMDFRGH